MADGVLTIKSIKSVEDSDNKVYRGIASRNFTRKFTLADDIVVKDGSLKVDMFTASAITKVYDAVNDANKKKMEPMLNGKKAQFLKIADFAMKQVRR